MKILIIEDESALLEVLRDKFVKSGFEVKTAKDGAIDMKFIREFFPDMILLDLILPKKSGFEILEDLKNNPETRAIPVIVLSNLGEDENIKRALFAGAVDYFSKTQHPINEVVEKVKDYILSSPRRAQ